MNVGERIRLRRTELDISQTELAKLVGVTSKSSVSKTELGGNDLTLKTVRKYAKALHTTPSWLMGLSDSHEPSSQETLTAITKTAEEDAEMLKLFHTLDSESRTLLIDFIKSLKKS